MRSRRAGYRSSLSGCARHASPTMRWRHMLQKIPGALPVSNEAMALFSSAPGEEVADYTEQVNGVYFEAGFALGLGFLVIPTCRENQIGKLHFDIRHLNTLPWKTPEDLSANLTKRILAVVGVGPNITPAT